MLLYVVSRLANIMCSVYLQQHNYAIIISTKSVIITRKRNNVLTATPR